MKIKIFTNQEKHLIKYLSSVLFIRTFSVFLLLPIFNILAVELKNASIFLVSIAFGIYGLTQGVFQIPFGILSDKWNRKHSITIGMCIFILGSFFAAVSNDIYLVILGRIIQGAGAVSSSIFAFIGDNTRAEVRSRAHALLGISVGSSFIIAFIVAPILVQWFDLKDIFSIITLLGVIGLLVHLITTPTTAKKESDTTSLSFFRVGFKNKQLLIIYCACFVCSFGLTAVLFQTQIFLSQLGFPRENLWMIYLPMLIASTIVMVVTTIFAETRKKYRQVFQVGCLLLFSSFVMGVLFVHQGIFILCILSLIVFFMGFNIFEPLLPSLTTTLCEQKAKGTVSGILNTFQFIGHFIGAATAGFFFMLSADIVYYILIMFTFIFFFCTFSFKNAI